MVLNEQNFRIKSELSQVSVKPNTSGEIQQLGQLGVGAKVQGCSTQQNCRLAR